MAIQLESPYPAGTLRWYKGNLHTHTTQSDGSRPPQEVVDRYAARGFDFLMISDHDLLLDPATLDDRGMLLIPGNEITAGGPHLLHVNARSRIHPHPDRQQVIDAIAAEGGFSIVNHPNWEEHFNHCPQSCMEQWQGYAGIEIYNGVIRILEGEPLATDRWDLLLSAGRRVWGYANDDSHDEGDDEIAWNMVHADTCQTDAIVEALRAGCCYASTGVTINAIRCAGCTIHVESANAQHMVVCADYGREIAWNSGRALTYTLPPDAPWSYLRIECYGPGRAMAWTQPFFVRRS